MTKKSNKLLITGSAQAGALETIYQTWLQERGWEVEIWSSLDELHDLYQKNWWTKVLTRFGRPAIFKTMGERLINKLETFQPDIVWVFRGHEFTPEYLAKAKAFAPRWVNYNPDHPFENHGRQIGQKNIIPALNHYDGFMAWHPEVIPLLQTYNKPILQLPFGYEAAWLFALDPLTESTEKMACCFVGTWDKKREQMIHKLANRGISIDLYGEEWQKGKIPPGVQWFPKVTGPELYQVMRNYRVQINAYRPFSKGSHNMRCWEVPAAGGILLTPNSPEMRTWFDGKKEVVYYKNEDMLLDKVEKILDWPYEKASRYRERAAKKADRLEGAYKIRAQQVHRFLKTIF